MASILARLSCRFRLVTIPLPYPCSSNNTQPYTHRSLLSNIHISRDPLHIAIIFPLFNIMAANSVYTTDNIAVPTEIQEHFPDQYNMDDPEQARMNYMRIMHEHTKQQFQIATASSRRRHSPATHDMSSLTHESTNGSVSSTAS
ncbi:hypothetical protein CAC42_3461 [Sphaceloma murrayae]|uniref:Uncharacterized protein n=1 Tax=Sphaceloma murrayae TaxID=2082308 RepID=A0A2K1R1P9_9PEZI|nr:hypothetical protein CAC42_3461 [Sphaceloma murrayae]